MKLLLVECHWAPLTISQHWVRYGLVPSDWLFQLQITIARIFTREPINGSLIYSQMYGNKFSCQRVEHCRNIPVTLWQFLLSDIIETDPSHYHVCWWPGYARSQGIISHGIYLVHRRLSVTCVDKVYKGVLWKEHDWEIYTVWPLI